MLGEVTRGIFATAQRCVHDLLVLGGNVTRWRSRDPADQARQPVALGLDVKLVGHFEQPRRFAMGDQRTVKLIMPVLHRGQVGRLYLAG